MANWLNKIDISDLHSKYDDGELDATEVAAEVVKRLKELEPRLKFGGTCNAEQKQMIREELQDVIDEMEMVGDVEDYDSALRMLYDLGDLSLDNAFIGKKLIWINTFATA